MGWEIEVLGHGNIEGGNLGIFGGGLTDDFIDRGIDVLGSRIRMIGLLKRHLNRKR